MLEEMPVGTFPGLPFSLLLEIKKEGRERRRKDGALWKFSNGNHYY